MCTKWELLKSIELIHSDIRPTGSQLMIFRNVFYAPCWKFLQLYVLCHIVNRHKELDQSGLGLITFVTAEISDKENSQKFHLPLMGSWG